MVLNLAVCKIVAMHYHASCVSTTNRIKQTPFPNMKEMGVASGLSMNCTVCTKCIQSVYKCGLYKFFLRQCTVQFVGMADCVVQWMYSGYRKCGFVQFV
jgi:hypothetical protein